MDIVSFETAKKLKAAGFPEPEFACWQVWYNALGIGTFLGRKVLIGGEMHFSCYSLGSGRVMDMIVGHGDGTTFAPTVEDILAQPIAEGYGVSRQYDTTKSGLSWVCCPTEWDAPEMVSAYHETSAAEAAALAWIKLKQKK